ncbi:MAG: hypothetical protein ABGW79_01830, partial [Pirellulales bacterium]
HTANARLQLAGSGTGCGPEAEPPAGSCHCFPSALSAPAPWDLLQFGVIHKNGMILPKPSQRPPN